MKAHLGIVISLTKEEKIELRNMVKNRFQSQEQRDFRYMIKDEQGRFYQYTGIGRDGLEYDFFRKQIIGKCYKSYLEAEEEKKWLENVNQSYNPFMKLEVVKVPRKKLLNQITDNNTDSVRTITITRRFTR
jgi:hypothetical protein